MSSGSPESSSNLSHTSSATPPALSISAHARSTSQLSSSAPPSSPTTSSTPIFDRLRGLISLKSTRPASNSSTTTAAHPPIGGEGGGSSGSVDTADEDDATKSIGQHGVQDREEDVSNEVQQAGEQGREAETSSSDGGDFVETSEGLGEGFSTPAPRARTPSSSSLQPTSAAFQPSSFVFPAPATTSSPPTTTPGHEPICGLWTPAKSSSEVRMTRKGSAGEEVKDTLRKSVRRRSFSSEKELEGDGDTKLTSTPLSTSPSSPVWERAKSAAPVKLQRSDGSPVIVQPQHQPRTSVPHFLPAPSQSSKVSIRSPTAAPIEAPPSQLSTTASSTSIATTTESAATTFPRNSVPTASSFSFDLGSTKGAGEKIGSLADASQDELQKLIDLAGSTRKLMETSTSASTLPSSHAPASPASSASKGSSSPTLSSPPVQPRKLSAASAATFVPVEIPPFHARHAKSSSPSEKEEKEEIGRALKPSASEYVSKRKVAPRVTVTTATPKKEGESSKPAGQELSRKEIVAPSVKRKLTVPEGYVVYAEKTPSWCPPSTTGDLASLNGASAIRRPSTTNGNTTNSSHTNPAVSYLPSHDYNPYASPITAPPTDFRAYALPWTSPPPAAPSQAVNLSTNQAYQQAYPLFGASPSVPPPGLGMPPALPGDSARYMSAVQNQVATYQQEVQKAREESQAKEAQLRSLGEASKAQARSLEESNQMLKSEVGQLKGRLVDLKKKAEEKDKWEERARTSRSKELAAASEKEELKKRLEEVEQEKADVETRLGEACQELIDREDEEREREASRNSSHPSSSSSSSKHHGDTITDLERNLFDAHDTINRLESSLAAKEAEVVDLKKKEEQLISTHDQQKSAFQRQTTAAIEQIKRNRDELAKQVDGLESDRRTRELRLKEAKESAADLSQALRKKEEDVARLEEERGRFDAKMQVMREKVEEEKQRRRELESSLGARGSPATSSNAEVEALRRKNADLLANAAEASLLMDDLVASLEPQEKENAELKDLVDGLMQDLERVTTELEDLKSRKPSPSLASTPRAASPTRSISASVQSSGPAHSVLSAKSNGSVASIGTKDRARAFAEQLARGKAELQTEQDLHKAKVRRYGEAIHTKEASIASLTAR